MSLQFLTFDRNDIDDTIIPSLKLYRAIAFTYVIDYATVFSLVLSLDVKELNCIQHLTTDRTLTYIWVSIMGKHTFRFDINSLFHEEYLSEKLGIVECEALVIKDLLLKICANLKS